MGSIRKGEDFLLLQGIELVSWDFDGTLYDHQPFRRRLLLLWLKNIHKASTWRQARLISNFHRWVASCHHNGGEFTHSYEPSLRALVESAEQHWFPMALRHTPKKVGALKWLEIIKDKGIPQYVVSDFESYFFTE